MFDDILIDQEIDDFELLFNLYQHESFKELENYEGLFEEARDLGEIDLSPELLDYIGGLNGSCVLFNNNELFEMPQRRQQYPRGNETLDLSD